MGWARVRYLLETVEQALALLQGERCEQRHLARVRVSVRLRVRVRVRVRIRVRIGFRSRVRRGARRGTVLNASSRKRRSMASPTGPSSAFTCEPT